MLSPDLFKNQKELHANIVIIPLFTHVWHDDDEVELHTMPAQHHDNINGIENSSEKWNRQNTTSKMGDPLRVL